MISPRAYILTLVLLVVYYTGNSQTLTTVSNNTVLISPSYTINSGTTYTVTGEVKNVGSATINNNVHVNVAIDTSSANGIKKYYWRSTKTYSVTNFLPNATFPFSVNDAATVPNGYKTTGNGVTIVVWTSVGPLPNDNSATLDSVFTTIYILPLPQSIQEELMQKELIKLPNPITQNIQFTNTDNWIIDLIDINGKIIELKDFKLDILNYSKGFYLLRFRDLNMNTLTKKILIQ